MPCIDGDTIVVGASLEDSNAVGVGGDPNDNSVPESGAAYVFVRTGTVWTRQAYLKASNAGSTDDEFGSCVSISGDAIVVGARFEDSGASGVNGNQADDRAPDPRTRAPRTPLERDLRASRRGSHVRARAAAAPSTEETVDSHAGDRVPRITGSGITLCR